MSDDLDIVTYGHWIDCPCGKSTAIGLCTLNHKLLEADLENYRTLKCENCGQLLLTDAARSRILAREW